MTVAIDGDKLMGLVFKAVDEVGATLNAALVVMGDRLGYYQALADDGPATPGELAERTNTSEHYTREWLNAQAAGGYVEYDPGTGRYTSPTGDWWADANPRFGYSPFFRLDRTRTHRETTTRLSGGGNRRRNTSHRCRRRALAVVERVASRLPDPRRARKLGGAAADIGRGHDDVPMAGDPVDVRG